jgi:transposase-like protein
MARTGRKPKLTPDLQKRFVDALLSGNFIDTACNYVGISPATYYDWMKQGEKSNAKPEMLEFSEAVKRARAEAEVRNVSLINTAARDPRHWTAAAWFLERSYPTKWGRQQKVELTGANGAPISLEVEAKQAIKELLDQRSDDATSE